MQRPDLIAFRHNAIYHAILPVFTFSDFFLDLNPQISPLLAEKFKNSPLMSADIERVFSVMGDFLAPQRMNLTIDNLKQYVIIKWSNALKNVDE